MAEKLPPTEQQTTGQLLRRIVNGINGLVDRQIQLAKQEVKEDILDVLRAGKTLGIGAGVAVVGALILLNVLTMALVLGLNEVGGWLGIGKWPGWVAVLILLGVIFFFAYRLVMRGLREVRVSPLDRTRRTLKEDAGWAQRLLTRNGK